MPGSQPLERNTAPIIEISEHILTPPFSNGFEDAGLLYNATNKLSKLPAKVLKESLSFLITLEAGGLKAKYLD